MEGRRHQPAHLVPPKGRGTGPAPPPLIPMWHRSGPTRLSKAEPDLCQLMDRKEMAEGAMAPKCEVQQPGTEGVQGRDGCLRTRVKEKSHGHERH